MHSFRFENSKEAAKWDADVLKSYDDNFEIAIDNNKNTTIAPGSDFRNISRIRKFLAASFRLEGNRGDNN